MSMPSFRRAIATALFLVLALGALTPSATAGVTFRITRSVATDTPFTGRVYLLFGPEQRSREPRIGPGWFTPLPFVAADVEDWTGDETIEITAANAVSYPVAFEDLAPGPWQVQAVIRLNRDAAAIGAAPGNAYSSILHVTLDHAAHPTFDARIEHIVPPHDAPSDPSLVVVETPSAMLSAFHGREIMHRATVILPTDYADHPDRRYPVEYWIGGFGSDHRVSGWALQRWRGAERSNDIVRVVLDPDCFGGHHVFADSANNGPRGTALVEEFIPHLERTFRFIAERDGRFLSGHSSGGWSSLWLQVTYPDTFGGTWSIAPDPVAFTSFQNPNIYADGANLYVDADGNPIPVAMRDGVPFAYTKDFAAMENVYGEGGQLRSFEWVFSPRGADGLPKPLWDRATGAIDPAVAEAWRAYDIREILKANWAELAPKLNGRVNIFVGDQDTFYLCPAVVELKETLDSLGADVTIEIMPGHDHGSLATPQLKQRVRDEELARSASITTPLTNE